MLLSFLCFLSVCTCSYACICVSWCTCMNVCRSEVERCLPQYLPYFSKSGSYTKTGAHTWGEDGWTSRIVSSSPPAPGLQARASGCWRWHWSLCLDLGHSADQAISLAPVFIFSSFLFTSVLAVKVGFFFFLNSPLYILLSFVCAFHCWTIFSFPYLVTSYHVPTFPPLYHTFNTILSCCKNSHVSVI